jgi:hypothetical protein
MYLYSVFVIYSDKKYIALRRFVLFMFVSIISYLLLVLVLFVTGSSHTPFLRNGFFIPVIIIITIVMTSFVTKKKWAIYALKGIVVLNLIAGVYLFARIALYHGHPKYPVYVEEQYLKSKVLINFLKNKNVTFMYEDNKDTTQIWYYAYIYNVSYHK